MRLARQKGRRGGGGLKDFEGTRGDNEQDGLDNIQLALFKLLQANVLYVSYS